MTANAVPQRRRHRATVSDVQVTVYVDVDLDEGELAEQGFVYVGDAGASAVLPEGVLPRLQRWHEDHHQGAWTWCQDELCSDIVRTVNA